MSSILIVTWDGAGALTPTLGIAAALADAGHHVRLLGHRSIDVRCANGGWDFVPFASAPEYDSANPGASPEEEIAFLVANVFFSGDTARDTMAELDRSPADAVLVDAFMSGALCGGEAAGVPTAALFHMPYSLLRGGPLLDMVSAALPLLHAIREDLGLASVDGIPEFHDRVPLGLVASVREFDVPCDAASNVRFIGPILGAPALAPVAAPTPLDQGPDPLVLVSFSTSQMGQTDTLQRVLDGLADLPARVLMTTGPAVEPSSLVAPSNAEVVAYARHDEVLQRASAVVTHAGHGTVMSALAAGVPLVCMPMGRDQFFNAARVEQLGLGTVLASDVDARAVRDAVSGLLGNESAMAAAKDMAGVISGYDGARGAVTEIERLVESSR